MALAITVPVVVGVIDAEQLDAVALTVVRVQGDPVNDPDAVPVFVIATVPAGVDGVPAEAVSLTNTVHVVACPMTIGLGAHDTVVVVGLLFTVTVLLVPLLPL